MTKKFFVSVIALALSLSVVSCGNSSSNEGASQKSLEEVEAMSPKEQAEYFDKQAEAFDSLSPEEQAKYFEEKFGEGEASDKTEGEGDSSGEKKYEPSQEILSSDFTSGLIQIGNDVFKCGGYLTISDFIEEYGDRYDCSQIDVNRYMVDMNVGENFFTLKNKTDDFDITIEFAEYDKNNAIYPKGVKLSDAIIYGFKVRDEYKDIVYYPTGLSAADYSLTPDFLKTTFSKTGEGYFGDDVYNPNDFSIFGTSTMSNHADEIIKFSLYEKGDCRGYGISTVLSDENLLGETPTLFCGIIDDTVDGNFCFSYLQCSIKSGSSGFMSILK